MGTLHGYAASRMSVEQPITKKAKAKQARRHERWNRINGVQKSEQAILLVPFTTDFKLQLRCIV
jgi:hypothetical protein